MLKLHIIGLIKHNVPVVTIDSSLLVEGLLAYVAHVSICKLLSGFELNARDILDVWG